MRKTDGKEGLRSFLEDAYVALKRYDDGVRLVVAQHDMLGSGVILAVTGECALLFTEKLREACRTWKREDVVVILRELKYPWSVTRVPESAGEQAELALPAAAASA